MQNPRIEANSVYCLHYPSIAPLPILMNSPHSGENFPESFLARAQLGRQMLRRASDLYVDALFAPAIELGAVLMRAELPRSFVDLNREPLELDPRLIEGVLPLEANWRSLRVAGGLGTVPRVIGDQIEIYAGKIALEEALARVEHFYLPYHRRLQQLMGQITAEHGHAILIDCHSMPSVSAGRGARSLPDLVIGDRFGMSAAPDLVHALETIAGTLGLRVERNQPYAGGYITEHYGRPAMGWHAIQIEVNRALYMDEASLLPHSGFERLQATFTTLLAKFFASEACQNRGAPLQFHAKAAE